MAKSQKGPSRVSTYPSKPAIGSPVWARQQCLNLLIEMDLGLASSSGDPEGIHKARVASKRLRALCHLLRRSHPGKSRRLSQAVGRYARALGGQRDQQVLLALAEHLQLDAPKDVRKALRAWSRHQASIPAPGGEQVKRIRRKIKRWQKRCQGWRLGKVSHKGLERAWRRTCSQEDKLVRRFAGNKPLDLHTWRKLSKRRLYQGQLLQPGRKQKQLKRRASQLGDWHDLEMLRLALTDNAELEHYLSLCQHKLLKQVSGQVLPTQELL